MDDPGTIRERVVIVFMWFVVVAILLTLPATLPDILKRVQIWTTPGFATALLSTDFIDSVVAERSHRFTAMPGMEGAEVKHLRLVRVCTLRLTDADRANGERKAWCFLVTGIYRLPGPTQWMDMPPGTVVVAMNENQRLRFLDGQESDSRFAEQCPCRN